MCVGGGGITKFSNLSKLCESHRTYYKTSQHQIHSLPLPQLEAEFAQSVSFSRG